LVREVETDHFAKVNKSFEKDGCREFS
jgi:hypothetical protein